MTTCTNKKERKGTLWIGIIFIWHKKHHKVCKYATYCASLAMKGCEYMRNSFPHAIYSNLIIKTSIRSRGFSNNAHINFVSDKIHHRYSYFSLDQFLRRKKTSRWNSNGLILDFFPFFLFRCASFSVLLNSKWSVIYISSASSFNLKISLVGQVCRSSLFSQSVSQVSI